MTMRPAHRPEHSNKNWSNQCKYAIAAVTGLYDGGVVEAVASGWRWEAIAKPTAACPGNHGHAWWPPVESGDVAFGNPLSSGEAVAWVTMLE